MKNCDLFVSGPEFAMARMPRLLNCQEGTMSADQVPSLTIDEDERGITLSVERISSGKGLPQMLWPPLPEPEGSPVCIMNPLMFRCQRQLS